jgi:tripartite-type tricarboxylate transporter receptor subunit TctC
MFEQYSRIVVALLLSLGAVRAQAQVPAYPSKPVRVIVALAAGSGADLVARIVTAKLAEIFGQQFVIENRGGAGGNIGVEAAARAAPDGYTLLTISAGQAINPALYPKLNYNLEKDLEPIGLMAYAPLVLVVHPSLPVKSVAELIAFAKARPGKLYYASSGNGSSPHLAAEMFKAQAGVNIVHVPYKGSPQAVTDLIAGEVSLVLLAPSTVMSHVQSGRLRALAVCGRQRSVAAPGLPTMAEAGLPGFEAGTWTALLAPAGTAPDIITRLNRELANIVRAPDVRDRLAAQGFDALSSTPAEFAAYLRSEIAKWGKVVKATGVRVD